MNGSDEKRVNEETRVRNWFGFLGFLSLNKTQHPSLLSALFVSSLSLSLHTHCFALSLSLSFSKRFYLINNNKFLSLFIYFLSFFYWWEL
jgi:hypothetical protein